MASPFQDNADGSREFDCTGCDMHVVQAVSDGFDFPVCCLCRWFDERPHIPAEVKGRVLGLRGRRYCTSQTQGVQLEGERR